MTDHVRISHEKYIKKNKKLSHHAVAGPIFDHFPKEIFVSLILRMAISQDFASFFK